MITISLIVALVFGLSAVKYQICGQILNGHEASIDNFKYMVLISPIDSQFFGLLTTRYRCAGTIIAPNWVLTAAHCVHKMSEVYVIMGAHKLLDAEILYKQKSNSMFIHPSFEFATKLNDIALIQIPKTSVCESIEFAQLPFNSSDSYPLTNKIGLIMGWGRKGDTGSAMNRLHWSKTSIMSNEECQAYEPHAAHSKLCINTRKPYGAPCQGDSGGPLVLEETGEQIGIVSYVKGDSCELGKPVILTRVKSYLRWIAEVTGLNS